MAQIGDTVQKRSNQLLNYSYRIIAPFHKNQKFKALVGSVGEVKAYKKRVCLNCELKQARSFGKTMLPTLTTNEQNNAASG